jgi:lipopolysaccharide transport system permease protein
MFVKRDFVSFYKQTILGPLWYFIQPLFTTIIYTVIFGRLAGLSSDGLPQPLFYMAVITAWNYFQIALPRHPPYLKTMQIFLARCTSPGSLCR